MSNYLDFPNYEEMVEMYQANFLNNDGLYDSRNDRQEKRQQSVELQQVRWLKGGLSYLSCCK